MSSSYDKVKAQKAVELFSVMGPVWFLAIFLLYRLRYKKHTITDVPAAPDTMIFFFVVVVVQTHTKDYIWMSRTWTLNIIKNRAKSIVPTAEWEAGSFTCGEARRGEFQVWKSRRGNTSRLPACRLIWTQTISLANTLPIPSVDGEQLSILKISSCAKFLEHCVSLKK